MFERTVIVCGGRNYNGTQALYATLDEVQPTFIINGGAKGADAIGARYALDKGIPFVTMPALWDAEGRSAGPQRNKRMGMLATAVTCESHPSLFESLFNKTILVACPGGRGTAHMRGLADAMDWEIVDVDI